MKKGISAIVATLLMLIITITLVGAAWTFISSIFTSRTAQILEFVDFHNGEIIVRNSGTAPIPVANIKIYVSGSPEREAIIKSDKDPIPPGQTATLTILDAYNYNGRKNIRVVTPGSSFRAIGNFGNNYPEGSSTWYARIGKHTGWGINDCGWNCNDWINTLPDNSWRWIPNLVAWYRFDESSGTIANDETTRNDGNLVNGPQWVDGKYGKALSFDGVDDYANNPTVTGLSTSSISFLFWSKQLGTRNFFMHPIGIFGAHSATIYIQPNSYNYYYKFETISGVRYEGFIKTLDNDWHFIAATFDGQKIRIYVDGNLEKEISAPGSIDKRDNSVFIGTTGLGSSSYGNYFYGIIDEVMIFNRALSDEEIKLLYEQGIGKFSSPASWDASSCPVKVYSGYFVCCMCEDPAHNCAGCEIAGWFKKFVTVPTNVKRVWMKFSTDDPIRIYVNGQLAYETGCCCNPCPPIELTPYIKKGAENLITVKFYEGCWCGYFGGNIWYDNLIDNGGFEEGTWSNAGDCCCGECSCTSGASCSGITGGSYCTCPNAPGGSCQFTATLSTDAKEGKYSLNLTGRNACACNAKAMLTYEIGKTYKLSFWYKHVQGPDCPRYCMWVCGRNVCDPVEYLCDAVSRDGNWHYYEKIFTVQPGSTCMSLHFYGGDGSDTQFSTNLYDDVRIIEIS
jgi:flagellin-like protein